MQTLQAGLEKKQLKNYIVEQLNAGVSKGEIENNLKNNGYGFESYKKIISRYPELALKNKYKILNRIVIFLLIWISLAFLIQNISVLLENNAPAILSLLGLILPVIAIFYVIKYDRWAYYNIAVFSLILIFQSLASGYPFGLIPLLLILFCNSFLFMKLYPESPLFGDFWKRKE
ncbi:MAG: hypothetical protein A2271_01955 [Candidatus Moranbacteria bacterium RIFOXYA12_FULL_35_19]|nr:MAG: hypothetical protein UR78_C0011G0020 [Candidatus Moranbacteria bacterium GW2011_GWF2_35_39]OGI33451.1 MAG: hypothetical protein A2489_03675 [Candidatus Moranbacteria bacterium RIFOXYC12_FULL_36_13]OGI36548.1 MAG: hypothetical protein A2271_01955 [Candidatus Moranbacteria bacterium RIFOXYA12_FULL_35_19]